MKLEEFKSIVNNAINKIDCKGHKLEYSVEGMKYSWIVHCKCLVCKEFTGICISNTSQKLTAFSSKNQVEYKKYDNDLYPILNRIEFFQDSVINNMKLFLECARPELTCDELIIREIIK